MINMIISKEMRNEIAIRWYHFTIKSTEPNKRLIKNEMKRRKVYGTKCR